MKRYIKGSSELRQQLDSLVDAGRIPKDGAIIKDAGVDTYYWKIEYVGDIDEYEDINDYVVNGIFALELPEDPFGGMAWGDLDCSRDGSWEYSSYEEAENDDFGTSDW